MVIVVLPYLSHPRPGVVIRTYGAGNIPAARKDLLAAFKSASDRGVLMVNVTQCYQGGVKAIYSTGMILNNYGVIPGYVSHMQVLLFSFHDNLEF